MQNLRIILNKLLETKCVIKDRVKLIMLLMNRFKIKTYLNIQMICKSN